MKDYYILVQPQGVYTKDGDFFISQGGLESDWGKHWEKVQADDLDHARQIGILLRRKRYPDSHKTIGEEGLDNPILKILDLMGIKDDTELTNEQRSDIARLLARNVGA